MVKIIRLSEEDLEEAVGDWIRRNCPEEKANEIEEMVFTNEGHGTVVEVKMSVGDDDD